MVRGWIIALAAFAACGAPEEQPNDRWVVADSDSESDSDSDSETETVPADNVDEPSDGEGPRPDTQREGSPPTASGAASETDSESTGPVRLTSGGEAPRCRAPTERPIDGPRRVRGNVAVVWHSLIDPEEPDTGMLELDYILEAQRSAERWVREVPAGRLRRCYDAALRRDRALRGGMRVKLVDREGEIAAEVETTNLDDERLAACVSRVLSRGPRLPGSPFHATLGFCPRHQAACFAGHWGPREEGVLPAGLYRLFQRGVEPDLSECVSEGLDEGAGSVPLHIRAWRGAVRGLSVTSIGGMGMEDEDRSVVARCLSTSLSGMCLREVDTQAVYRVQVMVQHPRR